MIADQRDGFGVFERWFWRTAMALTVAAVWYFLAIRPGGRPLERVAPEPPHAEARNP